MAASAGARHDGLGCAGRERMPSRPSHRPSHRPCTVIGYPVSGCLLRSSGPARPCESMAVYSNPPGRREEEEEEEELNYRKRFMRLSVLTSRWHCPLDLLVRGELPRRLRRRRWARDPGRYRRSRSCWNETRRRLPRLLPGFSPGPAHAGHRRTNTELGWYATTQVAAHCAAPQDFGNRRMRRAVHVRQDLRRLGAHNPNTQLPHNDAHLPCHRRTRRGEAPRVDGSPFPTPIGIQGTARACLFSVVVIQVQANAAPSSPPPNAAGDTARRSAPFDAQPPRLRLPSHALWRGASSAARLCSAPRRALLAAAQRGGRYSALVRAS